MPYKQASDRRDNARLKRQVKKLAFYEALGLTVVCPADPWSDLECEFCGKQTKRCSPNVFRHHSTCLFRPIALKVLDHPREYWSRRPGLGIAMGSA